MYHQNQRGQSLMSVMVSIAISGIVILVVLSIIEQQNKSLKQFQQKSELIQQQSFLQNVFDSGQTCDWQFATLGQTLNTISVKADGTLNSTLTLTKLHAGMDASSPIIAQVGQQLSDTRLRISSIKFENIRASGTPNRYYGELNIAFNQNAGEVAYRHLTVLKTIIVDPTSPAAAKMITGCAGGMTDIIPFPASCQLRFAHQDGSGPIRQITHTMDKPGFRGLTLTGNVDSNDKFYVGGTCSSVTPGSMEEYIQGCSFELGLRDNTQNANHVLNSYPAITAAHPMSSSTMNQLNLVGDVDQNDSVYFRFRCNVPTNDKAKYFFENCYVCFGYSDWYRPQPDTKVCSPISLYSSTRWSRFSLIGDVDFNDIMYLGFTCGNTSSDVIFDIQ